MTTPTPEQPASTSASLPAAEGGASSQPRHNPRDLRRLPHVPVRDWGSDHWKLVLHLETRAVDHRGQIDLRMLRTNIRRADRLKAESIGDRVGSSLSALAWKPSYGTRLRPVNGQTRVLEEHCDAACLLDFEREGLVVVHDWTDVEILEPLIVLAHEIRRRLARGESITAYSREHVQVPLE